MITQSPSQGFKQQEKSLIEQQIQEHKSLLEILQTELKTKYSDEELIYRQEYNLLAQQLQQVEEQLATCEADIAAQRKKGYALDNLYHEKHLCLQRAKEIKTGMLQMRPDIDDRPKVLLDNHSVLSTAVVRDKSDAEVQPIDRTKKY